MAHRLVACILAVSGAATSLAACGSDEPSADARACEARAELTTAVSGVADDLGSANLGAAREGVGEVRTALDSLAEAVSDLGQEQADALSPLVEDLRAILGNLAEVTSLDQLTEALADARDTVAAMGDQLQDALTC